jgi:hypothetical protein
MKKILLIGAMVGVGMLGLASQANAGVRVSVGIGGYYGGSYYGAPPYYYGYAGPAIYFGPGYYPWYSGYYRGGYYHGGNYRGGNYRGGSYRGGSYNHGGSYSRR